MANTTTPRKDEKLNEAMDKGRDAVDKAKDAASKFGEAAGDAARSAASKVGDTAGDLAHAAGQKADQVVSTVGEKAQSAADAVRQHGPRDGMLGSATKAVADTIDQGGRYLEKEGLTGMMNDVTELIKRNPVPALFVGIGIGYLIGRALDRS